jgi:transcriptional regulator with XRE-family HTH domain
VVGQNAVSDFDPDRLRRLRCERHLTQDQLDRQAGLPPRTVVQYENGHRTPYANRLLALAEALAVSPVELTAAAGPQTLAQLRTRLGLTQSEAAEQAGLVRTRYSAVERGETASLTVEVVARIAAALGVTAAQVRSAHARAVAVRLARLSE